MSKKIILSILFLCLLPATFVWAQDGNSLSKAEKTALHEARLDSGVLKNPKLVDAYPDSMWYDNASYIFCRSPLYQRNGYTAIFSDYFNGEAVGYGWPRGGWRGYRLVWRIRRDSLFIQRIYKIKNIEEIDTDADEKDVRKRMEKFVGSKFGRRDVMFVNWVSGDFRVLTHEQPPGYVINEDSNYFEAGFTFTFEKGILKDVKKNMKDVVYIPSITGLEPPKKK